MDRAGGIDLGGTKIEAQRFDLDWQITDRRRLDTPKEYAGLVAAVSDQVAWLRQDQAQLPVGIAAAGLANPNTGNWIAANLSADGQPFVADVERSTGKTICWLNDCRAFTQAEAILGSGSTDGIMVGLVLGTGIAGGIVIDGKLINEGEGQAGEFGHLPLPAEIISRHELPVLECGCGRRGCIETYGSGPGMQRLAAHFLNVELRTREIVQNRSKPEIEKVWDVWCEINAALINTLIAVLDPKTIVLGGGLSQIPDIIPSLERQLANLAWSALPLPLIRLGTRGETAAAAGAAYAALQAEANV